MEFLEAKSPASFGARDILADAGSAGSSAVPSVPKPDIASRAQTVLDEGRATDTLVWVVRGAHFAFAGTLLFMAARTLRYVIWRRQGRAGGAHAARLMRFWAVFGLVYSGCVVLSIYTRPLQIDGVVVVFRALAAVILALGPRLGIATRLYDGPLRRFYAAHADEIEGYLAHLNAQLDHIDDTVRVLAKHLLDHLAVGGLRGAGRALTALLAEAEESADAARKAADSAPRLSEVGAGGGRAPSAVASRVTARRSRAFYGGAAHERAQAAAEAPVGFVSADSAAAAAGLRPMYDASRAMRANFRRRAADGASTSQSSESSKSGPPDRTRRTGEA